MKTSLPTPKGFTLIELLVVISIIAVLAAIALTVYNGVLPKARNDRRRADIESISKALEVYKTNVGYVPLTSGQFTIGIIPDTDPQGYLYCGNSAQNVQTSDPGLSWTTTCPLNYAKISISVPVPATGVTSAWKICTWLEAEGTQASYAYCRSSAQ